MIHSLPSDTKPFHALTETYSVLYHFLPTTAQLQLQLTTADTRPQKSIAIANVSSSDFQRKSSSRAPSDSFHSNNGHKGDDIVNIDEKYKDDDGQDGPFGIQPDTALSGEAVSEKPGRVNRKDKRFVVKNKDPRALAAKATSKRKKRPAESYTSPLIRRNTKRRRTTGGDELNLAYRSIKAISMPARIGLVPGQIPPVPDPNNLPFGDTEDYENCLIVHWCDELEVSYGTAAALHNKMFPDDQLTDEAVCKRHIRVLQRLSKKYGPKPVDQIGPIGQKVRRRGKVRAPRLNGIVPQAHDHSLSAQGHDTGDTTTVTSATTTPSDPQFEVAEANSFSREAQKSRDFEKACIVVWKDSLKMGFRAIRDKLETEHDWSLGLGTISKYYFQNVRRVYGDSFREDTGAEHDYEDEIEQEVIEAAQSDVEEDVSDNWVTEEDIDDGGEEIDSLN
ncbi:Nn.00g052580.m01.CDS01 [Neocucurbitaria sp. VM-36]